MQDGCRFVERDKTTHVLVNSFNCIIVLLFDPINECKRCDNVHMANGHSLFSAFHLSNHTLLQDAMNLMKTIKVHTTRETVSVVGASCITGVVSDGMPLHICFRIHFPIMERQQKSINNEEIDEA